MVRYGRPPSRPTSKMVQMFGWWRAAAARASRRKRSTRVGGAEGPNDGSLRATFRPSSVSSARYTAPIPPLPRTLSTRYRPNVAGRVGNGSSAGTETGRVSDWLPSAVGRATNGVPHRLHLTVRPERVSETDAPAWQAAFGQRMKIDIGHLPSGRVARPSDRGKKGRPRRESAGPGLEHLTKSRLVGAAHGAERSKRPRLGRGDGQCLCRVPAWPLTPLRSVRGSEKAPLHRPNRAMRRCNRAWYQRIRTVAATNTAVWISTIASCGPTGSSSRPSQVIDSTGSVPSRARRPQKQVMKP